MLLWEDLQEIWEILDYLIFAENVIKNIGHLLNGLFIVYIKVVNFC